MLNHSCPYRILIQVNLHFAMPITQQPITINMQLMATNNAVQIYMPPTVCEGASMFEKIQENEKRKNEVTALKPQNPSKATALRNLFSMDAPLLNLTLIFVFSKLRKLGF
jgi:hypothetical protein